MEGQIQKKREIRMKKKKKFKIKLADTRNFYSTINALGGYAKRQLSLKDLLAIHAPRPFNSKTYFSYGNEFTGSFVVSAFSKTPLEM